ncbi:hypothetical protein F4604DRAFT_1010482 [Suillus subluteus]|nr:hypothetical protein F4604DRAFT_1010482 [Suillus subluteus]
MHLLMFPYACFGHPLVTCVELTLPIHGSTRSYSLLCAPRTSVQFIGGRRYGTVVWDESEHPAVSLWTIDHGAQCEVKIKQWLSALIRSTHIPNTGLQALPLSSYRPLFILAIS